CLAGCHQDGIPPGRAQVSARRQPRTGGRTALPGSRRSLCRTLGSLKAPGLRPDAAPPQPPRNAAGRTQCRAAARKRPPASNVHGSDQHGKVQIDLEDTYHGTARSISVPTCTTDDYGMPLVSKRMLKVSIPKGVRAGQTLRLAGQGFPGMGEGKAGDLYLEV